MTALLVATAAVLIIVFILAFSRGRGPEPELSALPGCKAEHEVSILDPKDKIEVDKVERSVFAKADLIQKMIQGMTPANGTAKSIQPVDPATQAPDETAFMKAITDKVEQIKRLSKSPKIG